MKDKKRQQIRKEKASSRKKARKILDKENVPKFCEYCGVAENEFIEIWGEFYGGKRGKKLEVDHKDNDYKNNKLENLCWACSLCNCAKSDILTWEEMKKVGIVIQDIRRERISPKVHTLHKK